MKPIGGGKLLLKYVKKKCIALLLPLIVWELIVRKCFFTATWGGATWSEVVIAVTHPGLWFLLALFRISVLYGIWHLISSIYNIHNKLYRDLLFIIPVLLLSGGITKGSVIIDNVYLYTLFYYLGVLTSKHELLNKLMYNRMTFMIAFLVFAVFSCHWSLASGSFDLNDLLKLFIATSAFVIVMNVCRKYETEKVGDYLSLFGCYSMEIYVVHWTLLSLGENMLCEASHINCWWIAILSIAFSLPIIYACIFFSKVAECSPFLRMCLFGRRK